MRILVSGTRGVPDIPGGVEKHCQELYPRIAKLGHDIILCTRSSYIETGPDTYGGVRLLNIYAPRRKSFEAIIHTFLSLILAIRHQPDVVHIHAIGPSLMVPLARLLGYKVVMTHHGSDYERQKWTGIAKWALRTGEWLGGCFSHEVIAISQVIEATVQKRCGRPSNLIYNGVPAPRKTRRQDHLERLGVLSGKYILAVARFVPEKGLHDLVRAFGRIETDIRLVIAGDADHETRYSKDLKELAKTDNRIVLPGYVTGEYLDQLYSNAFFFVLPSYHEGLPIALLEAMSYGLPAIVSDIPANREVGLDSKHYYRCGDVEHLKNQLSRFFATRFGEREKSKIRDWVLKKYDWQRIALQTVAVYRKALNR